MTSGDQTPAARRRPVRDGKPGRGNGPGGNGGVAGLGPLMDLVTPMALRVAVTLRLRRSRATRTGCGPRRPGRPGRRRPGRVGPAAAPPGAATVCSPSRGRARSRSTGPPPCCAGTTRPRCGGGWTWTVRRPDGSGLHRPGAHGADRAAGLAERCSAQPFWAYLDANPAAERLLRRDHGGGRRSAAAADGYDWSALTAGGRHRRRYRALSPSCCGATAAARHADRPAGHRGPRAGSTWPGAAWRTGARSVGQSFFDPLPAGADAYLLNRVHP